MKKLVAGVILGCSAASFGCGPGDSSCAVDAGNGAGGNEGSQASGAGGNNAGQASGTGLALGTFCVQTWLESEERCETSGNTATRFVSDGNISMTIRHGSDYDCVYEEINNFMTGTTIPDGVAFPYSTVRYGSYQFGIPSYSCVWRALDDAPASGTVYQAGTEGSSQVEGDFSFVCGQDTLFCGTRSFSCSQQGTVRLRFNLGL